MIETVCNAAHVPDLTKKNHMNIQSIRNCPDYA
jgi:hypothetical protein